MMYKTPYKVFFSLYNIDSFDKQLSKIYNNKITKGENDMNGKLTILSMLLMTCLSLTSCVAKETKIETNAGNALIASSLEKTKQHIEYMSNEDFISILLNSSSTASYNVKLTAYDPVTSAFTQEFSSNKESNLIFQANLNSQGLKNKPNASLDNSEVYFESSSNSSTSFVSTPSLGFDYNDNNSLQTKGNLIGNNIMSYTEENGKVTQNNNTLDTDEANKIAKDLLEYIHFEDVLFEDTNSDAFLESLIPSIDIEENFPNADEEEFNKKFQDFINGELTPEDYYDYLNSVSKEPIVTDEEKKELLDALKFLKQGNITNYLHYTKIKKDKHTTISSALDFESFKNDINKLHDDLHVDGETSHISLSHIIYGLTPDNMNLSFSIKINNNHIIESVSYNTIIKGTIPSAVLTEIIGTNMLGTLDVHYDVSLSGNVDLLLDTKKITISTISELTNKQIEEQ